MIVAPFSEDRRLGLLSHAESTSMLVPRNSHGHRPIRVFVMLPLDTVDAQGQFCASPWLRSALQLLATTGVHGVAVDVWWGAVERQPKTYCWGGYKQLLEAIKGTGLKVQACLSMHACGMNHGDTAQIPLPSWVLQCGEKHDLFFTDKPRGDSAGGQRNREYLSFWADNAPGVLCGRSPMQCYEDFMTSFRDQFEAELGTLIEEVVVGAGPCGELRFPSYAEKHGWRFPGIGEFQCYDRRALASLAEAAAAAGHPEWGYGGPHDAGCYHSAPEDTGFFSYDGSWDTPYGRFFLSWYSNALLAHGERMLSLASSVFASKLGSPRLPQHLSTGSAGDSSGSETSTIMVTENGHARLRFSTEAMAVDCMGSGAVMVPLQLPAQQQAGPAQVQAQQAAAGLHMQQQQAQQQAGHQPPGQHGGLAQAQTAVGAAGAGTGAGIPVPVPASMCGSLRSANTSYGGGLGSQFGAAASGVAVPLQVSNSLAPSDAGTGDTEGWEGGDAAVLGSGSSMPLVGSMPMLGSGMLPGSAGEMSIMGARPPSMTLVASSSSGPPGGSGLGSAGGNVSGPPALATGSGSKSALGLAMGLSHFMSSSTIADSAADMAAMAGMPSPLPASAGGQGSGAGAAGVASGPHLPHLAGDAASPQGGPICNSASSLSTDCMGLSLVSMQGTGEGGPSGGGSGGGSGPGGLGQGAATPGSTRLQTPFVDASALMRDGSDADGFPDGLVAASCCTPEPILTGAEADAEDLHGRCLMGLPMGSAGATAAAVGPQGQGAGLVVSAGVAAARAGAAAPGHGDRAFPPLMNSFPAPVGVPGAGHMAPTTIGRRPSADTPGLTLQLKIAGIHWWYRSRSHAAELTAGYYNTATHDGYAPILELCARFGVGLTLTCVEMCDGQHPVGAQCSPEGLLKQIRALTARTCVALSGENALPIFLMDGVDTVALDRILFNTRAWYGPSSASLASSASASAALLNSTANGHGHSQGGHGNNVNGYQYGYQYPGGNGVGAGGGAGAGGASSGLVTGPVTATANGYLTAPSWATSSASGQRPAPGLHACASLQVQHPYAMASGPYGAFNPWMHPGGTGSAGSSALPSPQGLPYGSSAAPWASGSSSGGGGGGGGGGGMAGGSIGGGGQQHHGMLQAHHSLPSLQSLSRSLSDAGRSMGLGKPGDHQGIAASGLRTDSYADILEPLPAMRAFTFLRLGPEFLQPAYHGPWLRFMSKMQQGGWA